MSGARRRAAVLAATVAMLMGTTTVAYAGGPDNGADPTTQTNTNDQQGKGADNSDSDGTYDNTVNNCHVVSTSNFLGSYCPSGDQDTKTIKQIMAGEEFQQCWDERMTPEQQEETSHYDALPKKAYMEHCLMGIDPKTLKRTGPIYIRDTPEWLVPPYKTRNIGPNESKLLSMAQTTIPYPTAVASPQGEPRVMQWVSFYDSAAEGLQPDGSSHQIVVPTAGVVLTATEKQIVIHPRGLNVGDKGIRCPGGGHKAEAGEQGVEGGNCWYRYQRSSAGQTAGPTGNEYPVRITAYWVVTMTVNGQTSTINHFTKSATTAIPVSEIQAINVS